MEWSVNNQGFAPFDARQFRSVLGRFATGVTIITAELGDQIHGMTANAFMSVSLEPPLIVVSVSNRARMNELLTVGCNLGVSVLGEDQEQLSNHFAGRPIEGLNIQFMKAMGTPLIEEAIAHLVAQVVAIHPAGDHTLHVAEVQYFDWRGGRPLLFYGGKYRRLMPNQRMTDTWSEDEMSLFSMGSFDVTIRDTDDTD